VGAMENAGSAPGTKLPGQFPGPSGRTTQNVPKPSTDAPEKFEDVITPNFGEAKRSAVSGDVHVALDKVKIYARGGSPDVSQRLDELQALKIEISGPLQKAPRML